MSLRQTIRESWDVAVMVVLLGLILGWALFVALLSPLMGQTPTYQNEVWKATGENIRIQWQYPTDPRVYGFRLLRCTEANSCTTIATGGPATREFSVSMNSGKTQRYYLRVRVVTTTTQGVLNVGPASSEMIVNRK